ncbi:MAG: hypothetical protein IKW32_07530 [Bacteroidaceae bacterium]|nr:hypothetical protein [Bacteroidaceae bacterium]
MNGVNCPECGFDNFWYGTQEYVVCERCGCRYSVSVRHKWTTEEINQYQDTIHKIETNDVSLLLNKILKEINKGHTLLYARYYREYTEHELKIIQDALPVGSVVNVIKKQILPSDVFVEIVKVSRIFRVPIKVFEIKI